MDSAIYSFKPQNVPSALPTHWWHYNKIQSHHYNKLAIEIFRLISSIMS